ncbi:MAG: hypothetical protein Q9167_005387 [Letrouitia subvulpina]
MAAVLEISPLSSLRRKLPGCKGSVRYAVKSSTREPEFEMVKATEDTRRVVIVTNEASSATLTRASTLSNTSFPMDQDGASSISELQASGQPQESHGRPSRPYISTKEESVPTSRCCPALVAEQGESLPSSKSSLTLACESSDAASGTDSPVMRSIFPRYDFTIPLARQSYYSERANSQTHPPLSRPRSSSSPFGRSVHPQQEPLNQNSDSIESPTEVSQPTTSGTKRISSKASETSSSVSSPEELLELWNMANGQKPREAAASYTMALNCLASNDEVVSFDTLIPDCFYSMFASESNMAISRNHPLKPKTSVQICTPKTLEPSDTNPLITTIFPKLAELMAIDQASTVAVSHGLDRNACNELQAEAISRAHCQEASSLFWDDESQKFYLIHPTLFDDNSPAAFPIEVSPDEESFGDIIILTPNSHQPLIELSRKNLTLTIHVEPFNAYSSLYILDVLISAVFILLLHLHRSQAVKSTSSAPPSPKIPFFEPPPTVSPPASNKKFSMDRTMSNWARALFGLQPRISDGRQVVDEEKSTTTVVEQTSGPSVSSSRTTLPYPLPRPVPIIDQSDERLPKTTRVMLKILYWGFDCLVWALGVLVNVLAVALVGFGKLIKAL